MTENGRRLFFVAMFALVFYLVGASFVQSFVTYPTWKVVGTNEFEAYYHVLAARIVRVMVLPGVVEIPLTVALLRFRPRAVPRWPVALAIAINVVRFISTAVSQLRVQEQLSTGSLSIQAIDALIRSDYITQAASIGRALLYVWMLSRIVREPVPARSPAV